jgi:hypothetical protein
MNLNLNLVEENSVPSTPLVDTPCFFLLLLSSIQYSLIIALPNVNVIGF